MRRYFVKFGDFANQYHVVSSEQFKQIDGYERISRKVAETLVRRERERLVDDPVFSGYASAFIDDFDMFYSVS